MASFHCPYSGHRPGHIPDIAQGRARGLDPEEDLNEVHRLLFGYPNVRIRYLTSH